ncbi:hypothetical protein WD019_10420 [Fictibacillus sp. Mic-4]|uniref:hypothetical protein n=1 Tax=Fictibacillus sp. Mic-4 TaxID=3132826 RepID=UPI003CF45943
MASVKVGDLIEVIAGEEHIGKTGKVVTIADGQVEAIEIGTGKSFTVEEINCSPADSE